MYFCVFGFFVFKLSVPVQVIAWIDSSPKWANLSSTSRT